MVEPAVLRRCVLPPAVLAQCESSHGRVLPVVRQGTEEGESGAAVGAGGERVVPPPSGEDVIDAPVAYRGVGGDRETVPGPGLGTDDRESPDAVRQFAVRLLDGIDPGERGQFLQEPFQESLAVVDIDRHAGTVVAHGAPEAQGCRCAVDCRTETDTLDGPFHDDPHDEGKAVGDYKTKDGAIRRLPKQMYGTEEPAPSR